MRKLRNLWKYIAIVVFMCILNMASIKIACEKMKSDYEKEQKITVDKIFEEVKKSLNYVYEENSRNDLKIYKLEKEIKLLKNNK